VGPAGGWGSQALPITSIDYDRRIIHTRHRDGEHPLLGFTRNSRFVVENLLEALDQPGEWCADAEAGKLHFWPPADLDGVQCEDSQQVRILGSRFLGLGARLLALVGRTRPCHDVLVQGNKIARAGRCGIYVGGNARDCQILDNQIHHCGVFDKYSAGIEFPFYGGTLQDVGPHVYTDGILVAHNHLHDLPRDGIQLGANPYGRNVVEYNRVERAALETIDAGALRCHRVLADVAGVANLPKMTGHVFRYNFVADTRGCGVTNGAIVTPYPWPTFGIYLDEGSGHCRVYGNIVLRSGVGAIINPGEFHTIENNILAGNAVGIYYQAPSPFDQLKLGLGGNSATIGTRRPLTRSLRIPPTTITSCRRLRRPGGLASPRSIPRPSARTARGKRSGPSLATRPDASRRVAACPVASTHTYSRTSRKMTL
jgi:hypothetical protein